MRLKTLLEGLGTAKKYNMSDFEVKGITDNSRQVKEDFVFVAVAGEKFNGVDFIAEAIKRGARAIITQYQVSSIKYQDNIGVIKVKDTRVALGKLAAKFYGYPSHEIKCIGITGTNGKTTITYLLENILEQSGFNCGIIGTINYHFNDKIIPAPNTTPNALYLQSLLSRMSRAGVDYCALEVSSHSLAQQRVSAIDFRCAVFTNLTSDHLDYHKNRHYYFSAKAKLFKMLNKDAYAVINIDDDYGKKLVKLTKARVITYAIDSKADVQAKDLTLYWDGAVFKVKAKQREFQVRTKLIGRHNVQNILAAVAVALQEKIPLEDITKGVYNLTKVMGRLDKVGGSYPFNVFVDYAHTEDALKNVLGALRGVGASLGGKNKIITVFGCGGDRDRTKRPKMGAVAARLSDKVIITSDNPRSEEPQNIIDDISAGIKLKYRHKAEVVPDRYAAIKRALSLADTGDTVLIAGKGHEQYQVFKDKTVHFDDRKTARAILDKIINPK